MNMNEKEIIELVHSTKSIIYNKELAHAVTVKGAADYVTKVDVAIQEYLRKELAARTPDVILLAEEQENNNLDPAKSYWILDPIDGTTNLIHDYRMSAVSLGLYENGQMTFGVVYNPFTEETFHASLGKGAFLNGEPIHVLLPLALRLMKKSGLPCYFPSSSEFSWKPLISAEVLPLP